MAKVVKLRDSKGEEQYPITTGQAVRLKSGKTLDEAIGEKADKKSVLTKNEVYTKEQTYNKQEVFNKKETYPKSKLYSKDEVFNINEVYHKAEVFPRQETYSRAQVNSLVSPSHVSYFQDQDFTLTNTGFKMVLVVNIMTRTQINVSFNPGLISPMIPNLVIFVNNSERDCNIRLPEGCIAESPILVVPAGKIITAIYEKYSLYPAVGQQGKWTLIIRTSPLMAVV